MATEKTWDPSEWPTPEQLDKWLQIAEPHERLDFCMDALRCLQQETTRAMRAMVGSVGEGPLTIEDIGPVLDAIAEAEHPGFQQYPAVARMNVKNSILVQVLPGIELLLGMVNRQMDAYMAETEYRIVMDGQLLSGTVKTLESLDRAVETLKLTYPRAVIIIQKRTCSSWIDDSYR